MSHTTKSVSLSRKHEEKSQRAKISHTSKHKLEQPRLEEARTTNNNNHPMVGPGRTFVATYGEGIDKIRISWAPHEYRARKERVR